MDASDLVVDLVALPTTTVSYSVLAGTSAYLGGIVVLINSVNNEIVYNGSGQSNSIIML